MGRRPWRRWPTWVPYAAAAWSLGYGLVALAWTLTGSGFPLGRNDSNGRMSLLAGLPAEIGAPVFAVVALAGAGVGVAMARVPRPATGVPAGVPRWCRRLAVGFGSVTAAVWVVIVPDARILALVGYLPMLIVLAPFDAKIRGDVVAALSAAHVNHIAVIAGGFLWAFATLVFARRTAGTCEYCGYGASRDRWTIPVAAARWAGYVAAVIPALYALTRLAWVAGIPLGVDEEFQATAQAAGTLWSGAWLAIFALIGSVLTLGLNQRWGEVFPRWMPWLGGRPVPVGLAVVPASVVSVIVISGGTGLIRAGFDDGRFALTVHNWAPIGPALLWPLWGVALAAATLAYYLRRRDTAARHEPIAMTPSRPSS